MGGPRDGASAKLELDNSLHRTRLRLPDAVRRAPHEARKILEELDVVGGGESRNEDSCSVSRTRNRFTNPRAFRAGLDLLSQLRGP
jgi:hypothetical protein